MKNVAICHKEAMFGREVKEKLRAYLACKGIAASVDVFEDLGKLTKVNKKYDLLLVGPVTRETGIAFNRKLRERNPWLRIIYIADQAEHIEGAALLHAHDHLVRPFSREEFFWSLKESLLYLHCEEKGKKIIFSSGADALCLWPEEVFYVTTSNDHRVRLVGVCTYELRMTMREALSRTQRFGFARPHQSYIVNLLYVDRITSNIVYLEDGSEIPLARTKAAAFRAALEAFWR